MFENKLRALKLLTNLSVVEERDLLIEENRKLRQIVTKQQKTSLVFSISLISVGGLFGLVLAQLFPYMYYGVGMMYTLISMWAVANVFVGVFALYIIAYVMAAMSDHERRNPKRK